MLSVKSTEQGPGTSPGGKSLFKVVNAGVVFPRTGIDAWAGDETFGDSLYEVVDGVRVETQTSNWSSAVNTAIGCLLGRQPESDRLGRVMIQGLFLLQPNATSLRRPDSAFISFARWPRETPVPEGEAWQVAPDLAVECVSPTDLAENVSRKVREYFDAGVRLVWVVYPELRVVHVFESFNTIRVVEGDGVLEGGEVVPGFRLPMATLFEDLDGGSAMARES